MTAWIGGLVFFAAWGALLAWRYTPYHVGHVTVVTQSPTVHLMSFMAAFMLVFFSHLLIHWLMVALFGSPVFESKEFYFVSLSLTAIVFGTIFLRLVLWHERRLASPEGQEKLKEIIDEAAVDLRFDGRKENNKT